MANARPTRKSVRVHPLTMVPTDHPFTANNDPLLGSK